MVKKKGKKKRKLETTGGQEIEFEREYVTCQSCGHGFFPLDEELELQAGKLTPRGHEQLVRLSSCMPFEQAVELFEDFMEIHLSKDVGQRYTEKAGAVYEELQTGEAEDIQKKRPKFRAMSGKLQISADGCMVPIVAVMDGAEWLQSFTDYHYPKAVRILDFAHAAEHINQIGEFLHGEHSLESKVWLEKHLHGLKHGVRKKCYWSSRNYSASIHRNRL